MNDDRNNEIDLSQLRDSPVAPEGLENLTVEQLRQREVIAGDASERPSPLTGVPNGWAIAASVLLLVTGMAIGRALPSSDPVPLAGDYILLLHEPANRPLASDSTESDALYAEYAQWMRRSRDAGAVVSGERLGAQAHRMGESAEPDREIVSGYFVIQADSLAIATEIASECPHLRHGGSVEVRSFDRP